MSRRAFADMSLGSVNTMTDNKRIAKNTIIVYIRLIVVTLIGLFSSRFVLQALGVSDYGLYNVVGGVIALFAVISGSMSATTIRFLNFEIGKTSGDPNKVFNICQVTHIVFAFIILLLAETIGIFYVLNYLKVEPGKAGDAMFVFQVSTVVACIGIINVPYQSVFVAKEKFFHIAVIDIINALIKLGLIIILLYYKGNALRFYALIMSVTTLVSFVVYHYLCFKYWPELVRWKLFKKINEYKDLLVFNNYNLLAGVALMGRSQGSNILINFFFGTVVNGAYGIARTVQGFVEMFTVNFDSAAAPQITQSVGRGDMQRASYIASRSCRICQLLSLWIVLPLYVEMEFILRLWLGLVPDHAVLFCRVTLVTVLVASTGGGMLRLKDALGKIKWFMIIYSFWYFLTLPVGYYLFKQGYPPVTILVLYILSDVLSRISQLVLMKVIYNYDIITFMRQAYVKPLIILMMMIIYVTIYYQIPLHSAVLHFVGLLVSAIVGTLLVFFMGLLASERQKAFSFITKHLCR